MSCPREARTISQMVCELERQLRILEEHARRTFVDKNEAFLPEVATKLRLLLGRFGSNKPLLVELMSHFGLNVPLTIDGRRFPEGYPRSQKPMGGDKVTLEVFFALEALSIRTDDGMVSLTRMQLIRALSEQAGGAHADWRIDQALSRAMGTHIPVFNFKPLHLQIAKWTRSVLVIGRQVIAVARTQAEELPDGGEPPPTPA